MQDPALGLVERHDIHMDPLFELVQACPSAMSAVPISLVSSVNMLSVHLIPLSTSLVKMLNSSGPRMEP